MPFLGRTDFNIGEDVSVTIQSSAGDNFPADMLGHLVDISAKFKDDHIQVKTISGGGNTLNEVVPRGVTGKMKFVRMDGSFGRLMVQIRQRFKEQGQRVAFTFQVQIRNRDGSVDNYLITGARIINPDVFNAAAGKEVDCGFDFEGSDCKLT